MVHEASPASTSRPPAQREQWSGQFGFIMAAVGSAIGLGNIWRFPGVAYTNGGGAFMIPYVVALLTAGIPMLLLDYALGHRYQGSTPAVFRRISKKFEFLGWMKVLVCFVITAYYAVILAWALRYVGFSATLSWKDDPTGFFVGAFLQASDPGVNNGIVPGIFWPLVGIWIAIGVVMALGVAKGIEKANKFFIPLLVIIFVALVIRAITLPGASEGLNALFTPNWGALADPSVWIAAYSQIFFSLSVGFGIMVTYSSYLRRKSNIVPTGLVTGFANSSFELLAGLGVFATLGFMAAQQGVGVGELEGLTGVGLSFMTFPQVISMMPGGPVFGIIFFTSLLIAGFTSMLSLTQVLSAAVQEKFNVGRRLASVIVVVLDGLVSVLIFTSTDGLNVLDTVDKFINEIGVVMCAVITCILIAFVVKRMPLLRSHLNFNSRLHLGKWWYACIAVVIPIILGIMMVITVVDLLTNGYGGYPTGFLYKYGWVMVLLVVVGSFLFTVIPWRTPVDDFDAMEYHGAEATPGMNDSPTVTGNTGPYTRELMGLTGPRKPGTYNPGKEI
ncbi:MAG: sodium-dependent transporter [Actinomycetaceae bacterium]|nr:sodium-dependent transporter [Arcanobacterium sp.]MDD7505491.1 sodium-dependent transporter [Actinomycetaceae bacterium]MDY6143472.1 sodium-dependent transporter [Arcanobacterium sp.]